MPNLSSIAQLIEQESIQCMVVNDFRPCGKDHHRHYVIINMGQIKSTTAGGKKGKYFLQVKISRQKFQPFRIRQKVEAVLSYPC